MYEEKTKRFNIDLKSVIIKMAILLVVVFLFLWIVSLFTKKDNNNFDLATNLKFMKEAATDYFTGDHLPSNINSRKKITLAQMYDEKLLVEMDGACNTTESYAEATKISDNDYNIKVKIVCGDKTDYVINTISIGEINDDYLVDEDEPKEDLDNEEIATNPEDNLTNNNTPSNNLASNNTPTTRPNNTPSTNKPSTTTTTTTTPKPSTSTPEKDTCPYGTKDYSSSYPLAYTISGSCAVSKNDYSKYSNEVNKIGIKEYQKLVDEMSTLARQTSADLVVEQPIFSAVYNKTNTGLVGYQIRFRVIQNFVWKRTIYDYYIDNNGNRTVITDERRILSSVTRPSVGTTTSSNTASVTGISLDRSSLRLSVGDYYTLTATVTPSNAKDKTVTWSSSNPSVASVSTSGKITARSKGVATITATAGYKSTSISVSVDAIDVTKVSLNKSSLTLTKGDTYNLTATVTPSNATNKTVTWKSNNETVATVNSSGRITAKGEGTATITATSGNKSATVKIIVERDTKTYTNTYYVMSYISSKDVGRTLNQKFIFKDISKSAKITSVKVNYFSDSINDYENYANENWNRKIELYSGYNNTGYMSGIKVLEYFNFSLNYTNYNFDYNQADYGNYHGININTSITNLLGSQGYNDLYFVPLKIKVTYEI